MRNIDIKCIACLMLLALFAFTSCEDDNVGEFQLTGNIEGLIPEDSYELKRTNSTDGNYIVFTPQLDSSFEYWGLKLTQVAYYIDDVLHSTVSTQSCELMLSKNDLAVGNHTLRAEFNVVGEACEPLTLKTSTDFYISESGNVSQRLGEFYMDYNHAKQGEYLVITPELLTERSSEGCEIDQVKYYWDGALVATETTAPFSLKYLVNAEAGTEHYISATIYYHDNQNKSLTHNWAYSGYKVCSEDDGYVLWTVKSTRNDYVNGETVSMVAKLVKGENVAKDFEMEFYFDDELIGKSSTFPYTLDYKLVNVSVGSHAIKAKTNLRQGDATTSYIGYRTIIVTK